MALPQDGIKRELLEGWILMSPAGFQHGDVCIALATELSVFVRSRGLGKICDGQTGFRIRRGVKKKTVLSPDVSFVTKARIEAATTPLEGFFDGAPDLAVEVLSPGDRRLRLERKVALYFQNGCALVWIVDPVLRRVEVRLPRGRSGVKGLDDDLEARDLLPGFRVPVRSILG